jgi:hypothetical protein
MISLLGCVVCRVKAVGLILYKRMCKVTIYMKYHILS